MNEPNEWSPDEPMGSEAFEQGDEALDEGERIDPALFEDVEADPSLDPTRQVDERELEEAGAGLDDPEAMATLEGGIDDPDGLGGPPGQDRLPRAGEDGWDLDEPATTTQGGDRGATGD